MYFAASLRYLWILTAFLLFCSAAQASYYYGSSFDYQNKDCGNFCTNNRIYYEQFVFEQTYGNRMYRPSQDEELLPRLLKDKQNGQYQKLRFSQQELYQDYSQPFFSLDLTTNQRYSRIARDIGIKVSERGRSFGSAAWSEIRRPLLFEIKNSLLSTKSRRSLSLSRKVELWLISETIDSGARSLGLEENSGLPYQNRLDFKLSSYKLKFYPRVDILKGRYGVRLKFKKYLQGRRPLFTTLALMYCNVKTGFAARSCSYGHQISGSLSSRSLSRRLIYRAFASFRRNSRLPNGIVAHDWLAGLNFIYKFN